jgi:hypothetical protein
LFFFLAADEKTEGPELKCSKHYPKLICP